MWKLKRRSLILFILSVVVLAEAIIVFGGQRGRGEVLPAEESKLRGFASEVIERCSREDYPPACYDKEIPKLMDYISMEDAFRVTGFVLEKEPEYRYCHVLAHNLSAKEVAKSPGEWKDVLTRCPSGMCSNGCLHGGMQERFRAESLTSGQIEKAIPDIAVVCEEREGFNPTGLEQGSCYHALGHLSMYMANADVNKATEICRRIAVKEDGRNFLEVCYDGVFMQIFQPLEPEDFALVEGLTPKKEELKSFCSQFGDLEKEACWREGWPLYFNEIMTPSGAVEFCESTDKKNRCFNGLFYVIAAQFKLDDEKIIEFCSNMVSRWRSLCFSNSASRMIETDYNLIQRAAEVCKAAENYEAGEVCYQELSFYATFNFHPGSQEFYQLCQTLPEEWQGKCLSGNTRLEN